MTLPTKSIAIWMHFGQFVLLKPRQEVAGKEKPRRQNLEAIHLEAIYVDSYIRKRKFQKIFSYSLVKRKTMGYNIRNPLETLALLDEASKQGIQYACFFALDERPSSRRNIEMLNDCLYWIDDLSYRNNAVSLVFARTETEYVPGYGPSNLEQMQWESVDLDKAMEIGKLYFNPTALIAESLGVRSDELPGIIVFNPSKGNKEAKYIKFPDSIFTSISGLEAFLLGFYQSLGTDGCSSNTLVFDIDKFRTKCQEIINKTKHIHEPISNVLPYEERKNVHIFISYASQDRTHARAIYGYLKEMGFNPFIDVCDLRGGEIWDRKINEYLNQTDFFVACLSNDSVNKRGYIQREFKRALELWEYRLNSDIFVIPINLDECEIPIEFEKFHWIHYANGEGLLEILKSIEEGIRRNNKKN